MANIIRNEDYENEALNAVAGLGASGLKGAMEMKSQATKPEEEQEKFSEAFMDKNVRIGFIRKVYGIVSVQLTVTFAVVAFFMFYVGGSRCTNQDPECVPSAVPILDWFIVSVVSNVLGLVILILFGCCTHLRTQTPINYILLAAFTLCWSLSLGTVALIFTVDSIIVATGITLTLFIFLTIFTCQTKIEITACRGAMFCIFFVFLICGLIMIFIPYDRILKIVYAGIGATIFSALLIIDTQMMMGVDHNFSISPEEYVSAVICIYLDLTFWRYLSKNCKK